MTKHFEKMSGYQIIVVIKLTLYKFFDLEWEKPKFRGGCWGGGRSLRIVAPSMENHEMCGGFLVPPLGCIVN